MNTVMRSNVAVSNSNLAQLDDSIGRPSYDRAQTMPRLVHIGAGGFNRSHLAVYLDDLLGMAAEPRWGEVAVGLLPPDREIHVGLASQDHLYSLLQMESGHERLQVVGSLVEHLYAPDQTEAVLARMAAAECAIISLTVTEGGYFIEDATGRFLSENVDVHHDLQHSDAPVTWLGYVAETAERRRTLGRGPFTVLSCDNLQGNGAIARRALMAFAELRGGGLTQWIERNVTFPCSMVDRITPRTTPQNRAPILERFGVVDRAPVVCEPFRQWVLEDDFAAGRPAFEHVGVEMTSDVAPYEKMKMRILNGGHSTLGYFADLLGIGFIHEAATDDQLRRLLVAYMDEVKPVVPSLPGIDLDLYAATVVQRFSNTAIRDQVPRICSEGCAKIAKFLVPPLADLLRAGNMPRILPLVIAGWLHYQRGVDEQSRAMIMADAQAALLKPFVEAGCVNARLVLVEPAVFGSLAAEFPAWASRVQQYLELLRARGVRSTIASVLNGAVAP
ncbi:MAG: mannitol dehydrogenase family protein [Candidatus Sulfotelmatobacter sp.]